MEEDKNTIQPTPTPQDDVKPVPPKEAEAPTGQASATPTPPPVEPVVEVKEEPKIIDSPATPKEADASTGQAPIPEKSKPVPEVKEEVKAPTIVSAPEIAPSVPAEDIKPTPSPTPVKSQVEPSSAEASDGRPVPEPTLEPKPVSSAPVKVTKEKIPEGYCSEKGFWGKLRELSSLGVAKRKKIREDNLNKIISSFKLKDKITNNSVEELLGVSDRTASRYLKTLVKEKKLAKFGQKHNTFYRKYK